MKLVELLARVVREWPEYVSCMVQDSDGKICQCSGGDPEPHYGDWTICGPISIDTPVQWVDTGSNRQEPASDQASAIVTKAQWQAERDRQKGGEWKRHRGGKQPVADDTYIEYKLRDGFKLSRVAGGLDWSHNNSEGDIMQYRVISQPQAEEVDVIKVDPVVAANVEAFNGQWKIGRVDGPLVWRDTVIELDAYIEEFTRERDSLINRLALEGFALLPAMTAVMGVADVQVAIPCEEWTDGDIVRCVDIDLSCASLTIGKEYTVVTLHGEIGVIDDEGDHMCSCIDVGELEFVRRP